uniref:DAN domain-containing protein n=1 Tax=Panagrellus redivivus TaxID=6233 RepID=A0A7E4VYI3_PANRE
MRATQAARIAKQKQVRALLQIKEACEAGIFTQMRSNHCVPACKNTVSRIIVTRTNVCHSSCSNREQKQVRALLQIKEACKAGTFTVNESGRIVAAL